MMICVLFSVYVFSSTCDAWALKMLHGRRTQIGDEENYSKLLKKKHDSMDEIIFVQYISICLCTQCICEASKQNHVNYTDGGNEYWRVGGRIKINCMKSEHYSILFK